MHRSRISAPPIAKRDVGVAPAVAVDQRRGKRRQHQGAEADSGDGQSDGERPLVLEPSADERDHRYVATCCGDPDACAVRDVAGSQRIDPTRGQQPHEQRHRADGEDRTRPPAIERASGDHAEPEEGERGDAEDDRGGAAIGAELLTHRFEEGAEAVGRAERHRRRQERGHDDEPRPRRVTLVTCRIRCHHLLIAASRARGA